MQYCEWRITTNVSTDRLRICKLNQSISLQIVQGVADNFEPLCLPSGSRNSMLVASVQATSCYPVSTQTIPVTRGDLA